MKNKQPLRFFPLICILAGLCLLLAPAAASLHAHGFAGADCLFAALAGACAVLLMLPVGEEPAARSFRFSLLVSAVCVGGMCAGLPVRVVVALVLATLLGYLLVCCSGRYERPWSLFKVTGVWTAVENHARDVFALALFLLGAVYPGTSAPGVARWICVGAGCVLAGLLVARVVTGRTLLFSARKEQQIKEMAKGNLNRTALMAADGSEELGRMHRLYEKVLRLMEDKHPFLDFEFSIADLAAAVFSNRAYLSRTINTLSGQNFSQFVNSFRIRYSVELLRKDPTLKITNVAMMSGFRTTVTFNMAFKLNMGETPTQYLQRQRLGKLSE